jgi:glycosyltransferase involved in cell wall biosynthesis
MTDQNNISQQGAEKELPRVLILGQTFTSDTGGGITLSNLFKNWPKNKLAVAVESKEKVDFTKALNYYRIGYKELRMPFPFSIFQRKTRCGPIRETIAVGAAVVEPTGSFKSRLKNQFDNFLHYSGLFFWMYGNQRMSHTLLEWIELFNPDVIYFQPNSYKALDFALSVKSKIKVPMVTHVMDDWFSFAIRSSPLKWLWQRKLDLKIRKVFASTSLHLSICKYMSEAYAERYNYKFLPFHNSVDPEFWKRSKINIKDLHNPVKMLYAGRIGYGIDQMILKVASVIEKMGNEGKNIILEIQTKEQDHPSVKTLNSYKYVNITKPIAYEKLPDKLTDADILLIPCDFNGPGVKFIRYSMPTKVSEYMATGTPILVIGPPKTALIEYAKEGWAQLCISNEEAHIEGAVNELLFSYDLRKQVVSVARQLVKENHDETKIIKEFREKLIGLKRNNVVN